MVVLQLQIYWAEVQSCFVRVRSYIYVRYCGVCLQLYIYFTLSLVVNEISNNWRPIFVTILRRGVIEKHVL
jgi:hypothetical protein